MNNKHNLQSVSTEELTQLFREVVARKGYQTSSVSGNVIVGTREDGVFGVNTVSMFYCTTDILSGLQEENIIELGNLMLKSKEKFKEDVNSLYLVTNRHLSNNVEKRLQKIIIGLLFIDEDKLSRLIKEVYPEYDLLGANIEYLQYKNEYQEQISENQKFSKLPIEGEKYRKLLDFFISPRLAHIEEDKVRRDVVRKTHTIDELMEFKDPILIGGGAGAGKTTLLKQMGKKLFLQKKEKPVLPVFVTAMDIHDCQYEIKSLLQKKLESIIHEGGLSDIEAKYDVMLLVDSIDEFEDHWGRILMELQHLKQKYHVQYVIGTRNTDAMLSAVPTCKMYDVNIQKFNNEQIISFVTRFFCGKKDKADKLLDALRDNNIIEKLPITPLSLSLISILYDENGYEIPATITDIYDNFNTLILGRATISDKIAFIDIAFKERILSQYALLLLERTDHMPMTKDEFKTYFINIYSQKSQNFIEGTLDDALDYLASQTGILEIDKSEYVRFTHSSYMEYYASIEIFNNCRWKEEDLVANFYDYHWQNSTVFYAGRTKDMYDFLLEIFEKKIKPAKRLPEMFSCVAGTGYLLQALYFTDNKLRSNAIKENLRITLDIADTFKKLASDDVPVFTDYKIPVINIFTFLIFYESFRSITLKEPLRMAYDEMFAKYKESPTVSLAYKLLQIAFTLNSRAINYSEPFNRMINDKLVINDANLLIVACQAMEMLDPTKYKSIKKELESRLKELPPTYKSLMMRSSSSIRFTDLNTIIPERNVTLYVEGETDARIIEHAYMVLTNGSVPYWTLKPAVIGHQSSCASSVVTMIENAPEYIKDNECYIGILDHDAAGLSEYGRRLNSPDFISMPNRLIKKHEKKNIYAMIIPIPADMQEYNKADQVLNHFEIEHYFGNEFLLRHNVAHLHPDINDVYVVHDGMKTNFAEKITSITDVEVFAKFRDLFEVIDSLSDIHPAYVI